MQLYKNFIIETFGLPGVGKSTIISRLFAKRSIMNTEYISDYEAIIEPRASCMKVILSDTKGKVAISKIPYAQRLLYRSPSNITYNNVLLHLGKDVREFVHFCLQKYEFDNLNPIYRLKGMSWILDVLENYSLIRASRNILPPIIVDEGFMQKVHSIIPLEDGDGQNNYFNKMPKSDAYVYCYASVDVVKYRVIKRRDEGERLTLRHSLLSNDELYDDLNRMHQVFENMAKKIQKQNIPILYVNTEISLDKNINNIRKFVEISRH